MEGRKENAMNDLNEYAKRKKKKEKIEKLLTKTMREEPFIKTLNKNGQRKKT